MASEKPERLLGVWLEYVGGAQPGFVTEITGLIEKEIRGSLVSLTTNHILSGDTQAPPTGVPPVSEPFGGPITMGSKF